jgi:2-polyprenyl-3-methyl-5-hydroxy-6-metoxy-1,4-benzoquinol methylase
MTRAVAKSLQRSFWNDWNVSHREESIDRVSARQAEVVHAWLEKLGQRDLNIVEVGCGTGWFCSTAARFGRVTATDLSDEALARAQHRMPDVTFIAGDFLDLDLGRERFDVVVTLEVLSHVADQEAFTSKLASHLRPGGYLMMATQNRFVLQYLNRIPPPAPGQLRKWVSTAELRALLEPEFEILELFSLSPRVARRTMGLLRSKLIGGPPRYGVDRTALWRPNRRAPSGSMARAKQWMVAQLEAIGLGWTLMALARKRVS